LIDKALEEPFSDGATVFFPQHVELWPMDDQTPLLNYKLKATRQQHVHSIDIYFCKQRCGCRDDWQYKYVLCLVHLADMTRLYEPIDVIAHKGPPIAEGDMRMRSKVSVVSCIVVR